MSLPTLLVQMDLNDPGPTVSPDTIVFTDIDTPDATNLSSSSLVTPSWTPPSSGLIILAVGQRFSSAPNVPTVSGNSLTWVQIATTNTSTTRCTLFGADATGGTTGTTTIDFGGQVQTGAHALFMYATGVDLRGGVANVFVQAPTVSTSGTSGTITMAAAADSNNRPISAWTIGASGPVTPRTNWTEADDTGLVASAVSETQYRSDAFETTATVSWDGANRNYVGIAAELQVGVIQSFTTPTWSTDITPYVRTWNTNRGSQHELQRVEAGTATIVLDNRDGRFTPNSSTSPYSPNLLPMRRMRIMAVFNGVPYPIFSGFVESWEPSFPEVGRDQIVTVALVEGFKVLSLAFLSSALAQQLSGARVGAVLDIIGWPSGDRTIDAGVSTVPAVSLNNTSALEHLQAISKAERGRLFVGRDGKVVFADRTAHSAPSFSDRTWTDAGGAMSYRNISLLFNESLIINDARLTRTGGVEQVATSTSSIAKYFQRSFAESDIPLLNDADVLTYAQALVAKYGDAPQRIENLEDNAMKHNHWDWLLARDLHDRVLVVKTPKGATTIAQDSYIEGIAHAGTPFEWHTTLYVSPAP